MLFAVQFTFCTLIFYLAYRLFYYNKIEQVFKRFYLLLSLALSLIIPVLSIPVFPELIVLPAIQPISSAVTQAPELSFFTWESSLLVLCLIGTCIALLIFLRQVLFIIRIIKSGELSRFEDHTQVLTKAKIGLCSFLHYLIIPSESEGAIGAYERAHELAHIRQRHSYDVLFCEALTVIFWFNPVLYLYRKDFTEVHEYLADAAVIETYGHRNYQSFLIQRIKADYPKSALHNSFSSIIKKRLDMMHSNAKTTKGQYLALPVFLLFALGLFSFKSYPVNADGTPYEAMVNDSIPVITDTIILFDPATGKETVTIVKRAESSSSGATPVSELVYDEVKTGIDTVIVFDPADYSETMYIINHETGETDTIK